MADFIWTAPGMRHVEENIDALIEEHCAGDPRPQMILLAGDVSDDVGVLVVFNKDGDGVELSEADVSRREVFGSTAMYVRTMDIAVASVDDGQPALQHFAHDYDTRTLFDVVSGSEVTVENPHGHDDDGHHHH